MVHFRSRGIGLEQCIQLMKNSRNGTIWFHGEREKNTKLFFYHYLKAVSVFKFTYGYIGRKGDDIVFTGESTHCLTENGRPLKLRERYPKLFVTD